MKISKVAFATTLALTAHEAYAQNKCYAIAFSSGNQQAAFQAGALKTLAASIPAQERAYTNVSGVGGGSVNAAILASFAPG